MTLLEAVNLCLRSTGETGVAAINSAHPKIATILAEIDTVSKEIQNRSWWFNSGTTTLTPVASVINTTAYTFVQAYQRNQNYFPLGGVLVDGDSETLAPVSTAVKVNWRKAFTTDAATWVNLPPTFTEYVGNMAALSYAANY